MSTDVNRVLCRMNWSIPAVFLVGLCKGLPLVLSRTEMSLVPIDEGFESLPVPCTGRCVADGSPGLELRPLLPTTRRVGNWGTVFRSAMSGKAHVRSNRRSSLDLSLWLPKVHEDHEMLAAASLWFVANLFVFHRGLVAFTNSTCTS